jgi:hypothetical protein
MSMFDNASLALFQATSVANGGPVTYTRPLSSISANIKATFGKSKLVVDAGAGARIEVESNDFIVLVSALASAGLAPPREGDQVTVVGSTTSTYEVMQPPYAPSDSAGMLYRVHSRLVNVS